MRTSANSQEGQRRPLHEEVLLLALHDEKGTIAFGSDLSYVIGGALLADLLLEGRIAVVQVKRSELVDVADSTPTGAPLLDECLERIRTAKRRGSVSAWVTRFSSMRGLKERIAERLCMEGVLRPDTQKVFFVFNRSIYPTVRAEPERSLVLRIRRAILENTDADERTRAIIALADGGGLLQSVIEGKELRKHKKRIEELTRDELIGKATKSAIEEMHVALMAAT